MAKEPNDSKNQSGGDKPAEKSGGDIAFNDVSSTAELIKLTEATVRNFKEGDLVNGTVVRIERGDVYVDLNYKTEGYIPQRELSLKRNADPYDIVKIGDEIECQVLEKEDRYGRLLLSKRRAQTTRAWAEIEKRMASEDKVIGEVIEIVRGGLIVDIGVRGFLPSSLIDTVKVFELQPYLGQTLEMRVAEIDRARNNVILSRKDWLEKDLNAKKEEFIETVKVGQMRKGTVSSVVTFGAFIDLGNGIDGLVHISELSWKHVVVPSDVVKIGEEVNVEVIDVDKESKRISLSIKSTQPNPWLEFSRNHAIGQIVEGKVRKVVNFGAFVDLGDEVEGMIHISELASKPVRFVSHVLKPGDTIFGKITDIDLNDRRIYLSLKQANALIDIKSEEFDPSLYGMKADYDEEGNYKYPEGFDATANKWLAGYDDARKIWESEYAKAHALWMQHREQVERFNAMEQAGFNKPAEGSAEGEGGDAKDAEPADEAKS